MKKIILIIFVMSIFSCNKNFSSLKTVENVEIEKYCGLWYEIANYPNSFQKGCDCTTAEYTLSSKGYVKVVNRCIKEGKQTEIEGKAFVVENSNNSKLKVQFFWPFKGDYWIIDLDTANYKYAVVSESKQKYLWILYREKVMPDSLYNAIVERLKLNKFDISKIVKTKHY